MMIVARNVSRGGDVTVFTFAVANQISAAYNTQHQPCHRQSIREKIQEDGRPEDLHHHQERQDGSKENHHKADQNQVFTAYRSHFLYNQSFI